MVQERSPDACKLSAFAQKPHDPQARVDSGIRPFHGPTAGKGTGAYGDLKSVAEESNRPAMSRRDLFSLIGTVAGSAVMYEAMNSLAYGAESGFTGTPNLTGAPKGATVLILGCGWAGMVSAYELQKAGYKVKILEYQDRPGGRNWSLYGGDTYTELGGFTQKVQFDKGNYINPGP